jgi:hypothetical protein
MESLLQKALQPKPAGSVSSRSHTAKFYGRD